MKREIRRPVKEGRDQGIESKPKSRALDFAVAATQVLTTMCLIKGNPAWRGNLSLLFFGAAADLVYRYEKYREKAYLKVGTALGTIGAALLVWFGVTGQGGCQLQNR